MTAPEQAREYSPGTPLSGFYGRLWRDDAGTWRSFVINVTLVVVMFVSAIYAGVFLNARTTLESELHNRAGAIFGSIVLARRWSASYGGAYVEKKPGVESNPYLVDPDIRTDDGKVFTLKNPALMTREISAIAEKTGDFRFHITSLKLVNPGNAPDEWEAEALRSFESGQKEAITRETSGRSVWYRYMAPLRFEEACAQCHYSGYKVGDVRGGISVSFNIDAVEAQLTTNRLTTVLLFAITLATLLLVIYRMMATLYGRLKRAEARLVTLATTDELTGVDNRRQLLARLDEEVGRVLRYGRALGCVMFDIDHFKRINDEHGHAAGDVVLRGIGQMLRKTVRSSDIAGRYGGEEFIVCLPEQDLDSAVLVAEKLRERFVGMVFDVGDGKSLKVTVSFGVSAITREAGNSRLDVPAVSEALRKSADDALYRAKAGGRNRVERSG